MALIALFLGCAHIGMIEGAIPLEAGERRLSMDVQVSRSPGPVGSSTGIPLPQVGGQWRAGLGANTDLGIHVYTIGNGVDVRYRFARKGPWHFAIDPRLDVFVVPLGTLLFYTSLDLKLPLLAEWAFSERWHAAGGLGVVGRQTFFSGGTPELTTSASSFELLTGGGLRFSYHKSKFHLGISGNLYVDVIRGTGLYGGLGMDLGFGGLKTKAPPAPASSAGTARRSR
jgi:hypothetical protein